MQPKISILGTGVSALKRRDVLEALSDRIDAGQKSFVITPYPEFFYLTFRDYALQDIFNSADFSLADGVGVVWAAHYLSLPLRAKSYYGKVFEAFWQLVLTGSEIIFARHKIYTKIPERIPGSDFIWDLAQLTEQKNLSVYLLGGRGREAEKTAAKLRQKYPALKIAGASNADSGSVNLAEQVNASGADILMVAFGPAKQERWISKNLAQLNVKVAIGLGGTFDYISGSKTAPPKWVRSLGLEWLFRLFTQPERFKRIWHATFSFCLACLRDKVFMSMPYRENVVGVIINQENKVLVVRRKIQKKPSAELPYVEEHWQFAQGGTDGEDLKKAVLREMHEELGLTNLKVVGQAKETHKYLWSHALRPLWFNRLKYRGQEQVIFFLKPTGALKVQTDNREHDLYKWVPIAELPNVLHRFRQPIVKIVTEEIKYFLN